jgi:glutathione S-transferase
MQGTLPILYSFRRCPYAMRARLALAISGQACELREVFLKSKPAELLEASAKASVPVLVLPSCKVIDQSLDIMLWALQRNDPAQWLPTNPEQAAPMQSLIDECDQTFKHHLDRYKYPQRYEGADKWASRAVAVSFVADLEARLTQNHYLFGSKLSMFDAGTAPFLRQFAHVDTLWFAAQPWPHVQAWLAAFEATDAFKRVMSAVPPWVASVPVTVFP